MKASANMPLLVIVLWLSLLAPPGTVVGAAKLRRGAADGIEYAGLEDSAVHVDKKGNKGSKYTPSSKDLETWDELRRLQETWDWDDDVDVDKKGHTGGSKSSKYTPSSEDLEAWDELVYATWQKCMAATSIFSIDMGGIVWLLCGTSDLTRPVIRRVPRRKQSPHSITFLRQRRSRLK